jgi:hypothetical protein
MANSVRERQAAHEGCQPLPVIVGRNDGVKPFFDPEPEGRRAGTARLTRVGAGPCRLQICKRHGLSGCQRRRTNEKAPSNALGLTAQDAATGRRLASFLGALRRLRGPAGLALRRGCSVWRFQRRIVAAVTVIWVLFVQRVRRADSR